MTLSENITLLVNYRDNLLITLTSYIYLQGTDQNPAPLAKKALVFLNIELLVKILQEIQLCNEHIARFTAWDKWQLDRAVNPDLFKTADQYLAK